MKYRFALCAILLLAGCSGRKQAVKVYDAIQRTENAASRFDFEARVREAEKALDDAKEDISPTQYAALLDYKSAVTGLDRQARFSEKMVSGSGRLPAKQQNDIFESQKKDLEDFQNSLEACRDDAWRAVYGKDPPLSKTKAGDCGRLDEQRMERIRQESAKDIASKK